VVVWGTCILFLNDCPLEIYESNVVNFPFLNLLLSANQFEDSILLLLHHHEGLIDRMHCNCRQTQRNRSNVKQLHKLSNYLNYIYIYMILGC
jgi:hypothetical protein